MGQKATPPARIPVHAGKHQHRGQPAPGCCFGGRVAEKHLSLHWKVGVGLRVHTQQGLDRETTLLTFENSPPSLHPQNLPEAGTGIAGTWRNLHVHQPETGSTYPYHCMCHYRTNDSWPPATFKRRALSLGTNLMVQDIASTRSA